MGDESMLKDAYITRELSEIFGVTAKSVYARAQREGWQSRPRQGRGGGSEWILGSMPDDARQVILAYALSREALPTEQSRPLPPAVRPADASQLTNRQRSVMCARLVFLRELDRLMAAGVSTGQAMGRLVTASTEGSLPPHLMDLVGVANDRKNTGRALSRRSLQRWRTEYAIGGEVALAPVYREPDLSIPSWAEEFLRVYQQPSNPTLTDSYRQVFGLPSHPRAGAPSIWAVRRFVNKLTVPALEQGRRTGNAMLAVLPHRRRSTRHLWPTDIFTMDGTTFDAEVQHPHTGQPFKPEITLVLDVATRRCVGASVALAESAIATLDALRMACLVGGIPAMLHADNGSGYCNAMWTAEGTGLMARLGIELKHSIPGRPRGKGLMERAIGTICVSAAKRLPSYMGADADKDAAKKVFRLSRRALRTGGNVLPVWEDFRRVLLDRINEYNNTPHRGADMPRIVDAVTGRQRPMSPIEAWEDAVRQGFEATTVSESMREELFMPAEHRKVRNGIVKFFNGEYYHEDLAEYHGEVVEVRYEVWDSSRVYIYTIAGRKICVAERDAHADPYQPASAIEAADARRKKAQLKRLEAKAQRVVPGAALVMPDEHEARLSDRLAVGPAMPVIDVAPLEDPAPGRQERPLFLSPDHHYRWLMANREQCAEADEAWLTQYARSADYADMADRYEFEGIGWCPAQERAAQG